MLNISNNSIAHLVKLNSFKSYLYLKNKEDSKKRFYYGITILIALLIVIFVPWTQNIEGKGYVTTLLPEQRPQPIQSIISGRLEKWYVREGDYVKKGDTLIYITEVKNDYFDPNLISRTQEQVTAKSESITSYDDKINALKAQLLSIRQSKDLKMEQVRNKILQTKNKITIDSIDLNAYKIKYEIATNQLKRTQELYNKGLKSLSDFQDKELKKQETYASYLSQENKLENQKNGLINLSLELSSTIEDYNQKIAKTNSDIQSALSSKLEARSNTSKLRNQLSNYEQRQNLYYITSPTNGYITKTIKKGTGQLIKEGTDILTIMPADYDLAVEVYVKPQDLPLLKMNDHSRLRFDGWPAMVISGWPEKSTGIFSGRIFAIDQHISENGKYRVLIAPDEKEKKWPENLRVGTGTYTFILLKDVPVWYELWRNLNGFPPDFYRDNNDRQSGESESIKKKAPLKSVK
ncbi:HlyD family secretion protein [Wenyingzhuangia sp. 2_MG-2023]|uniref:HlyD family secretion protein n=1 Tax=Wenyingzhuangia sp. 2_MG-2023 TaxID=3062639 RepID=UPI0026E43DA0|nr:biotin/lipoyl-binding protein [Wenyingzhuangia sp. 2_MG-2023]MDO6737206.1 biotin/lipoyl-binding protein [Wenyingzhuangia sp. 2_MG-2023]MDO6801716.1 biotin/lipoyl-binding protein [Wenyingzhuangia sp. 1_MG-2023]